MTGLVKKLLIGASVVVGASTMGAVPSYAASLTDIQFHTDDIEVFYAEDAETALTDNNPLTNVELGASTENPLANVGFSGTLGGKDVKVETVTAADWAIFGQDWLTDFSTAYSDLFNADIDINILGMTTTVNVGNVITGVVANGGLPRSGDPNIGSFVRDDATGEYQLGLIGHYNLLESDSIDQGLDDLTGNPFLTGMVINELSKVMGDNPLQVSEVAKVTIDGVVNYAYSFSATDTEYRDADGSSHSGLYTWTFTPEPVQSVPEPSTMLGLMAVGGLATLSRRKSRNKV